jgi:hypothetical protein
MKNYILIVLLSFVLSLAFCQDGRISVERINKRIAEIEQFDDCKIVEIKSEDFLDSSFLNQPSTGYGIMLGYFIDDELVMIREIIGIRVLREIAITEYYFQDGKLIFVSEKEKPGPYVFLGPDKTADYRLESADFKAKYYFEDLVMIKRQETGTRQTILLPNEEYFHSQSKAGQLIYAADKYYRIF